MGQATEECWAHKFYIALFQIIILNSVEATECQAVEHETAHSMG